MADPKIQFSTDANRPNELVDVRYPMRNGAIFIAIMGVVAAIFGSYGWWVAWGAWLGAAVLLFKQPNREAQVTQQLRQDVGETNSAMDLRTFRLYWRNERGGGMCEFSTPETAERAAKRLLETNEAEGHIECYEMTWLPEVGDIPTLWLRWGADEQQWMNKWSMDKSDIGVIANEKEATRMAALRRIVIMQH